MKVGDLVKSELYWHTVQDGIGIVAKVGNEGDNSLILVQFAHKAIWCTIGRLEMISASR
jgi:hypothetical protein